MTPLEKSRALTSRHEGRYAFAYADSKGIPTIGVGFNMRRKDAGSLLDPPGRGALLRGEAELTEPQIDRLFRVTFDEARSGAAELVPSFSSLSDARQAVLTDMYFNLGRAKLSGFSNFLAALARSDWEAAAREMEDSAWWKQVHGRAPRLQEMMRSGEWTKAALAFIAHPQATFHRGDPNAKESYALQAGTPSRARAGLRAARAPSSTVAVAAAPRGASHAHAVTVDVAVVVAVVDARSGLPVAHARVSEWKVDGVPPVGARTLVTDENGRLRVGVPVSKARAGVTVSLSFRDFAVALECPPLQRHAPRGTPTAFTIEWVGPQAPPQWGWRAATSERSQTDPSSWAEFVSTVELRLPADPEATGRWYELSPVGTAISPFCLAEGDPAVVLFALQCCPPLWCNEESSHSVSAQGEVIAIPAPSSGRAQLPVALITRHHTPGVDHGRDFGTFMPSPTRENATRIQEHLQPRPHQGIDLAGVEGVTLVFAVCAGKVEKMPTASDGMGYSVWQRLRPEAWEVIYAHMPLPPVHLRGAWLRPGQVIGFVGRTSDVTAAGPGEPPRVENYVEAPDHLHLEVRAPKREPARALVRRLGPHASANETVLPDNSSPRRLPCDCHGGSEGAPSCARRSHRVDAHARNVEKRCWVRASGVCPYPASGG